jgi:hypothetical protein
MNPGHRAGGPPPPQTPPTPRTPPPQPPPPPPRAPAPPQVMKESQGRVNPGLMQEVLTRKLKDATDAAASSAA